MAENRVLGGVGTTLLFENDRVKVWEMSLEPGEEAPCTTTSSTT